MRCIKLNQILDGKALADKICVDLKRRVEALQPWVDVSELGLPHIEGGNNKVRDVTYAPRLIILTSGDDAASKVYVRNKVRRCEEIGIEVDVKHFDYLTATDIVAATPWHHPMIIQMPITGDLTSDDLQRLLSATYARDVDGFVTAENMGRIATGRTSYHYPCTPKGILRLLTEYAIPLEGKSVCIIGRSNIVGRPLSWMMEQAGATVTLCHSKTPEKTLYHAVAAADIVVSATGVRNVISRDAMLQYTDFDVSKKVFVDVGMNRDENGKLCGDIDPLMLEASAAYTPVPGGVGPMTVAMLMENVVEYYERLVSL